MATQQWRGFVAAAGALILTMAGLSVAQAQTAGPVVATEGGAVQGARVGDLVWFKGIPFAAPPVGDMRWRAPQPAKPWAGVLRTTDLKPDCASNPDHGTPLSEPTSGKSEDCLYLNIWKPAAATGPLPVLVWIYGGGFNTGGASPAAYDGANLARQGVMLVSFNYRVSQFGFFAHPALAKEQAGKPRGNYGFLDQIAALKWVRRNIAAFGGDPNNVTVFGDSAGGFSIHMLLISPLAKGLIDKAIIESGGGRRTIMNGQRMSEEGPHHHMSAEAKGLGWAKTHGIEGDGPEALAKLRALPTDEVLKGIRYQNPFYAGPMIDGTIVPYNMMTAYDSGRFAHIPLIIGTNTADMSVSFATSKDEVFAPFGDQEARARAIYDPDGKADLKTVKALTGADEMMHETARFTARRFAAEHTPVYLYRFGYVAVPVRADAAIPNEDPTRFGGLTGAFHGDEQAYVFDNLSVRLGDKATADDKAMAKIMSGYWVAFAKTGNPNGPGLPTWTPYDAAKGDLLLIGDDGVTMGPDPLKVRLDVTETLNLKTKE